MYCETNFKSKKELKAAVSAGDSIAVFQPGPFGDGNAPQNGTVAVEGPWYPQPHRWYAQVTLQNGRIVKVQ